MRLERLFLKVGVVILTAAGVFLAPVSSMAEKGDKKENKEAKEEKDEREKKGGGEEETAEELEKAARRAMEEAKKMLERARARRKTEKELAPGATKTGLDAGGGQQEEREGNLVDQEQQPARDMDARQLRRARRRALLEERRRRRAEIRKKRAELRAKRGRPGFYLNWMLTGALLEEDGGNRFTDRKSTTMAGLGLTFRGGGIIDNKHMIGGRLQTFVHLTKEIIDRYEPEYEFGGIFQLTMGPEYRYRTPFNMTFGFYVGLALTAVDDDLSQEGSEGDGSTTDIYIGDQHYRGTDTSDDRSVVSLALLGELGYEFRFGYWFGVQLELFAGLFHGFDDDGHQLNNVVVGTSVGLGF